MFTGNPFAEISAVVAPSIMQTYLNTGEWQLEKAPVYHIVD